GGSVVRAEPTPPVRPPKRTRSRPAPVEEATRVLRDAERDAQSASAAPTDRPPRRPDKARVASLPPRGERSGTTPRAKRRTRGSDAPRAPLPPRPAPVEDLGAQLTRAVGA